MWPFVFGLMFGYVFGYAWHYIRIDNKWIRWNHVNGRPHEWRPAWWKYGAAFGREHGARTVEGEE
jgi:hypothetical protein